MFEQNPEYRKSGGLLLLPPSAHQALGAIDPTLLRLTRARVAPDGRSIHHIQDGGHALQTVVQVAHMWSLPYYPSSCVQSPWRVQPLNIAFVAGGECFFLLCRQGVLGGNNWCFYSWKGRADEVEVLEKLNMSMSSVLLS